MTDDAGEAIAWSAISLVVFDVDGTLYDQRALRLRMLVDLAGRALAARSLADHRVLTVYRRLREAGTPDDLVDLERYLIERTSEQTGRDTGSVKAVVDEWIGQRPLRYLRRCRFKGLPALFEALRRSGKRIGVLSDYPADAKLGALELVADFVVSAGDPGVMVQKPDPRGLQKLMGLAGASPEATILIGDRADRDGLAATRAGAHSLLRASATTRRGPVFRHYDDRVFEGLLSF